MTTTIRRRTAGYYEIDTPRGTHTVVRLVVTRGMEGWETHRCGTFWMHTPPGVFEPSGEFRTLRDAIAYIRQHFGTESTRPMSAAYAANTAAANAVLATVNFDECDEPEDNAPIVARVRFAPADLERLKAKDDADRAAWRTSMDERKAAERERFGGPKPQPRWTPKQIADEIRDLEAAARLSDGVASEAEIDARDTTLRDRMREQLRATASAERENARALRATSRALSDGVDPRELDYR